jgi:type VI protein secretion system component Hcp
MKRKTTKSKASSSVRDLPVKTVNAKRGKGVKGGGKRVRAAQEVDHSEFSIVKLLDSATPKLHE